MELEGQTALVTGAAKRLGSALALALARAGSDVAIHHYRSVAEAAETVAQVRALGVKAVAVQADLSDPEQAAGLVGRVAAELGPVAVLVNSASPYDQVPFAQTDLALWQRHLAVGLTAPFLLSQAMAQDLAGGQGAILNLLDWRALRPTAASFAYTVAKAGLAAMTRSLAQSLAPTIRVNGLALGTILPVEGRAAFSQGRLERVPAGRAGTVQEACEAAMFLLAGPGYLTGEILHLDGGRHLL